METSPEIGELAKALCKAQALLEDAKKSSDNPFFKSKYADLTEVWNTCRKPLTDNGLSVVQGSSDYGPHAGLTTITTMLLHESGQWISSQLMMPLPKNDPQGVGSAITYGRRYELSAMVGICPEDDDAEGAMPKRTDPPKKKVSQPSPGTADGIPRKSDIKAVVEVTLNSIEIADTKAMPTILSNLRNNLGWDLGQYDVFKDEVLGEGAKMTLSNAKKLAIALFKKRCK